MHSLQSSTAREEAAPATDISAFVQAARDVLARHATLATLATLAAFSTALFFFHLGAYGLWEPDEGRYAEIAREMLATRDFVLPHLNYVAYIEKPPLLYWFTAFSFGLFGQNEFAARLVPAMAAVAGVLATGVFALKAFDRRRALLAGAIVATAPLYAAMAQVLTTDMLLTALVTVAMFSFFVAWEEESHWPLFYGAMGLGTLAKGPVAIVLPVLAGLSFLVWKRDLKIATLRRLHPVSGFILTLAIAAPWFIRISARQPEFARFYFFGEHIRRFLESDFSHGEPIYFYVPILLAGLLPWSAIAPFVWSDASANRPARDFCLIAAATTFIFFSIASGKLVPYILPALPPLAVAFADAILGRIEHEDAPASPRGRFVPAGATLAIIALVAFGVSGTVPHVRNPYLIATRPALLFGAVIAAMGAGLVGLCIFRARLRIALAAIVVTGAAMMVAGSYGRLEAEPLRSYAWLAREVEARAPGATLICYHRYVQSLAFYGKRRVILIGPPSELRFGRDHASDAREFFLSSDDEMLRLWNAPGEKVLVIDESDLNRLKPRLGDFAVIGSEAQKRAVAPIDRSS